MLLSLKDFREYDRTRLDLEEGGSPEQALLREHASISRSTGQVLHLVVSANYSFAAIFSLICFINVQIVVLPN